MVSLARTSPLQRCSQLSATLGSFSWRAQPCLTRRDLNFLSFNVCGSAQTQRDARLLSLEGGFRLQHMPRDCVGCFTESLPVTMTLFNIRISIWLVREKIGVLRGNIHIKYATSYTTPPDCQSPSICIRHNNYFPIIYTSTPRDKNHYIAQYINYLW